MHRCFLKPEDWHRPEIKLSSEEEHHLVNVLRVKPNDTVEVFDGCGREAMARIKLNGDRRVVLEGLTATRTVSPQVCRCTLIQALPKGRKMDLIIEKATELGVSTIVPVVSERVVARLKVRQRRERRERWQRIALSAVRQSGSCWVPDVNSVLDYAEALAICGSMDLFLVGSLGDDARPLHEVIVDYKTTGLSLSKRNAREAQEGRKPLEIGLLIGPEGDLTPEEMKQAVDAGAMPVSFGFQVLRVETAAIYGMSVLTYEFFRGDGIGVSG